jgi:hypothetical protein
MAMASKWTSVVPTVPGHYWVAAVIKGQLVDPEIKRLRQQDLDYANSASLLFMFGDSKIPEPLWEKI